MVYKHTFPLTHHNKGRDIACATCHTTTDNYRIYTCAGCHEHEPTRMARKHAGKGLGDISDCVRCHATGRKEERRRSDLDRPWLDSSGRFFARGNCFGAPSYLEAVLLGER